MAGGDTSDKPHHWHSVAPGGFGPPQPGQAPTTPTIEARPRLRLREDPRYETSLAREWHYRQENLPVTATTSIECGLPLPWLKTPFHPGRPMLVRQAINALACH